MINKIRDILIILLLFVSLLVEIKIISVLFYFNFLAKEITKVEMERTRLNSILNSNGDKLKFFKLSPLYQKYMNTNYFDSSKYKHVCEIYAHDIIYTHT